MSMTAKAFERSLWLLADHLSPYQSMMAGISGFIPVLDQNEGIWLVVPSTIQSAYNLLDNTWYCLTSEDQFLPHGDVILGIMLTLQNDTERFYQEARVLKNIPNAFDRIEEMLFRATFANSSMARPEDSFFDDECEKCDYSKEITTIADLCDYHRGLRQGMIVSADIETLFYSQKEFDFFDRAPRDGISSISLGFLEGSQEIASIQKMNEKHRILYASMLAKGLELPLETQADIVTVFWHGYRIVGHEALVTIPALLHEENFRLYSDEDPAMFFDLIYEATKRDTAKREEEQEELEVVA